jgi:hypothetical protein
MGMKMMNRGAAKSMGAAKPMGVKTTTGGKGRIMSYDTEVQNMAKGGTFRASANGIAKKGKTKGKQVKMASGGKC